MNLNDKWFFSDPPILLRFLTIFVWGDAIVLLPWFIVCFLVLIFNFKTGLNLILVTYSLRFIGEIGYWFLQQFSDRTYRPNDFGFKNISNNALYIVYQLTSTVAAATSVTLLILTLKYI